MSLDDIDRLFAEGRIKEALKLSDDQDIDYLIDKGISLKELEDYKNAKRIFNRIIELDPLNENAHSYKGDILLETHSIDGAIKCYNDVLALNHDNLYAIHKKAIALELSRKYREAIICINSLLDQLPNWEEGLFLKGNILFKLNEFDDAIKCYDLIFASDTHNLVVIDRKINALLSSKRYQEAIEFSEKVLNLNPDSEFLWILKGWIYLKMCEYNNAIDCFNVALGFNNANIDGIIMKGISQSYDNSPQNAINTFNDGLKIYPTDANLWYHKGDTFYGMKNYREAISCFSKIDDANKNYHNAIYKTGMSYVSLKDYEASINYFNKLLKIDHHDAVVWHSKSFALMKLKRYKNAVRCCDRALDLDYKDFRIWVIKAKCYLSLRNYRLSIECSKTHWKLRMEQDKKLQQIGPIITNEKFVHGARIVKKLGKLSFIGSIGFGLAFGLSDASAFHDFSIDQAQDHHVLDNMVNQSITKLDYSQDRPGFDIQPNDMDNFDNNISNSELMILRSRDILSDNLSKFDKIIEECVKVTKNDFFSKYNKDVEEISNVVNNNIENMKEEAVKYLYTLPPDIITAYIIKLLIDRKRDKQLKAMQRDIQIIKTISRESDRTTCLLGSKEKEQLRKNFIINSLTRLQEMDQEEIISGGLYHLSECPQLDDYMEVFNEKLVKSNNLYILANTFEYLSTIQFYRGDHESAMKYIEKAANLYKMENYIDDYGRVIKLKLKYIK